ncbi:MAG TPA: ATP-binding protein, partial [Desulfatiglandales bacterium]|nr:ATP-binding protein [Desulfatiglandales bacterium]
RLTGASRRFKEDFGDHIGSHCYEVYKHRTEPCINCPVQATFEDGKPHHAEEVVTALSGEQYNVLTWTAPIRDSSGEITQVMEMSTNITQIRKLESHLTSLGLLMSSTSHAIRGMLTSMDGGIYRLESGIKHKNCDQINDACEDITEVVNRIKNMVLHILYYTKERNLNWSRINVLDLSNRVASNIRPKAEKYHIEFVCDFDQAVGVFEADPETVSSALLSILENSIDACLDDRTDDKLHKVIFRVKEEKGYIIFDVHDNGIGMDRETKENMFTLFFSSKGHRGTGLGLFIANQIVKQHCGLIEVHSTKGKGSHFKVSLPKILPEAVKSAPVKLKNQ